MKQSQRCDKRPKANCNKLRLLGGECWASSSSKGSVATMVLAQSNAGKVYVPSPASTECEQGVTMADHRAITAGAMTAECSGTVLPFHLGKLRLVKGETVMEGPMVDANDPWLLRWPLPRARCRSPLSEQWRDENSEAYDETWLDIIQHFRLCNCKQQQQQQ